MKYTGKPRIRQRPLSYAERLDARDSSEIDLAVIHATELPDLETARAYGERIAHVESGTGNSGHYYIDRDGAIEQWVPLERVAHHVRGCNERSVGIELVNRGRYPDWLRSDRQDWPEPYPDEQIDALIKMLASLRTELPNLARIAGHDALDIELVPAADDPARKVRRKTDPGPAFPWERVVKASGLEHLMKP